MAWVECLEADEQLAEKIDAFVSRSGRLQDFIGEKLIPRFACLLAEQAKSLLDVLAYAEKMGWIDSAENFVAARKLRNLLVHEYMTDTQLFLQALLTANTATDILLDVVNRLEAQAKSLSLQ